MRVTAECTIDLDEKRKVWIQLDADGVETEEHVRYLADSVAEAAFANYTKALERHPEAFRAPMPATGAIVVEKARKKTEEEKLRGMGEVQ